MNIIILKILLSQIIGIILGLYFKDIALFVYFLIIILYFIFNLKKFLKLKFVFFKKIFIRDLIFFVLSFLIFSLTFFADKKYENLYNENIKISGIGEIVSFAEEKEYRNKYIIKIYEINNNTRFKNTKLILYLDKEINLEYGDLIYFYNSGFEKAVGTRNDKCFEYERYLRQSKIYGILNLENFEIISQNKGIKYNFFKIKNDLKNNLYEIFNTEKAGFLAGLLLRRPIKYFR